MAEDFKNKIMTVFDGGKDGLNGGGEDMANKEFAASTTGKESKGPYADQLEVFIEKGLDLARGGHYEEALNIFEEDLCFTAHPEAMSYYAICLASVEARYDQAISLCLMAVEKEFFNPNIYLNLGRIFLLNGQKAVAFKAFRKGLTFDNTHTGLIGELKTLGLRRRPVLTFLSRQNSLNKFLGVLTKKWSD